MLRRSLTHVCATAAALVAVIGLAIGSAAAQTIKIGSFLSVTGGGAFLGAPEKNTLELYVDKINQQGGVLGKKLELVIYDDATDAKKAQTFAKRLIQQDKVDLIIGGTTTGSTMAAIADVEQAGIPFLSLAGADAVIKPVKKWVFKTPHTDRVAVDSIFRDIKARGLSKLGLLSGAGGFDQSCRANAKELAPELGITLVADETHGTGDTDMTPQLAKIKGTAGVQAFLYCGFGAATSLVAKNFKQLGLTIPHYQTHGSASMSFIKGAAGGAEGVRLPAAALLVVEQLPVSHVQKNVGMAYKQAYESKFKEDISTFGGHAYDALFIVVEAIKRAGSTDRAKVRGEIEKTRNFIGVDGVFNMSPRDHMGLAADSLIMVEVSNNAWKLLK